MAYEQQMDVSIWVFLRLWVDAARVCPHPHSFSEAFTNIVENVYGEIDVFIRYNTAGVKYPVLEAVRAKVLAALIAVQYPGYELYI